MEHTFKSLDDHIESTLLQARRVFFSEPVDSQTAKDIIRKLWYLDIHSPSKPIIFILNCPGGSVDAGFAIWDQVKMLSSPIYTLVTGLAASMATVLMLCAAPNKRFATPNSRIMIHQPSISGVVRGQATDLDIQAKEIIKTRAQLVELYARETKQPAAMIEKKLDRDSWMSAEEAKEFGLIYDIIDSFAPLA